MLRKCLLRNRHAGGILHITSMTEFARIRPMTVAAAGGMSGHSRADLGGGMSFCANRNARPTTTSVTTAEGPRRCHYDSVSSDLRHKVQVVAYYGHLGYFFTGIYKRSFRPVLPSCGTSNFKSQPTHRPVVPNRRSPCIGEYIRSSLFSRTGSSLPGSPPFPPTFDFASATG